MESILVIDDDPGFRRLLVTILTGEGYGVNVAATAAEALRACAARKFDLVLTDLKLPDGDGLDVLRYWREHAPETPVIMITAFGTVASAVEAMKIGAADYLGKPLSSPDELRLLVARTLDQARLAGERDMLRERESRQFGCGSFLAVDPRMRKVLDMVSKVAPTQATVLLTGESGTGKEILARCIHAGSPRVARPFVPVNCAALSPTLIESELFGHEKGAFTGATAQHVGRFERAHTGTLFLDEIGELDLGLQAKLLRVLQERTFERVGGTRLITVDTRVIAATNLNLKEQIEAGKFREDLFYRLSMFPLEIPPLRDRPADIATLARHFLDKAARNLGRPAPRLTPDAEEVLTRYPWPGNVRELENLMERMAILCEEEIEPEDLPVSASGPVRPVLFHDIERRAIEDALERNMGSRTRAAKELGISLRTLQYRLKEYGVTGKYGSPI